jgi:hypothetical protein
MEQLSGNLVFVGSGLASLLVAENALDEAKKRNLVITVTFIEAELSPGGLYQSHTYSDHVNFDHGMHIYYETGDPELDGIWSSLLPQHEWSVLEGNQKDIAGVFYRGQLQKYSPYIDLRGQNALRRLYDLVSICIATLIHPKRRREPDKSDATAQDYFVSRFGMGIYDRYFKSILKKLFQLDGSDLSSLSTQLLALNRVVLLPTWLMKLMVRIELVSNRIAFPDQLQLPNVRRNHERGLYPRTMGIGAITSRLCTQLRHKGAIFHLGARVTGFKFEQNAISELHYSQGGDTELSLDCRNSMIYWCAGPGPFGQVAASSGLVDFTVKKKNQPSMNRKQAIVDCWIRRPNNINPLYYFYCLDEPFQTFRVTNFSAYSQGASLGEWDQVCVELWAPSMSNTDEISRTAVSELISMGVIQGEDDVRVLGSRSLSSGFPQLSVDAVADLKNLVERTKKRDLSNFRLVGASQDPSIFFLRDVLLNTKSHVWSTMSWC